MPLTLEAPRAARPAPRRRARLGALVFVMFLAVILGFHPKAINSSNITKFSRIGFSYDFDGRVILYAGISNLSTGASGNQTAIEYYAYDYRGRRMQRDEVTQSSGNTDSVTVELFSGGTSIREYTANTSTTGNLNANATQWTSANATLAPAAEYVRGSDLGGGIGGVLYSLHGNNASYYHYDGRGDVVAQTSGDNTGSLTYQAAYTAFGGHHPSAITNVNSIFYQPMPAQAHIGGSWVTFPVATFDAQADFGAQEWTAGGANTDRFRKNTKEEDDDGLVNEGQRYFNPETNTFLTYDPAGTIDGLYEWGYVNQNPWTKFDPEGLYVVIAPKDQANYDKAKAYLSKDPSAKALINEAEKSYKHYVLSTNSNNDDRSEDKGKYSIIHWDPNSALRTTEGGMQTPALGLIHEMDHAVNLDVQALNTPDSQYSNLEEKRVITGIEASAAKTLGEATRNNHDGTPVRVNGPTDNGSVKKQPESPAPASATAAPLGTSAPTPPKPAPTATTAPPAISAKPAGSTPTAASTQPSTAENASATINLKPVSSNGGIQ